MRIRNMDAELLAKACLPFAMALMASACSVGSGKIAVTRPPADTDWRTYGGNDAGQRYSVLAEITPENVSQLEQAWRFDTGPGGLQTSPIVVGRVLYAIGPDQAVIALNAATGEQLWRFQPKDAGYQPVRGLTYWQQGSERRLFTSASYYLYVIDPDTGQAIETFGRSGRIDLREGLGADPNSLGVFMTTPGIIYRDLIITGFRTGEGAPAAPGDIRAFDVRTGAIRWTFKTIPDAEQPGAGTWPAGGGRGNGAANNWAGMALDDKRGIVYVPTGSAASDFYGHDRLGDNLYANSLIALNATTGKRIWHFQVVHHDLWDRDLGTPPSLLTVTHSGRRIDAVAQAGKNGFLYLFDRVTGQPVFPIAETPVEQSNVPGERSSPTQPVPSLPAPLARQQLTEDMLTQRTPEAREAVLKAFRGYRSGGSYTPLEVGRKTVMMPGTDGGAEWGGAAVDPMRGLLYINVQDVPWLGGLRKNAPAADGSAHPGKLVYDANCASCHGPERKGNPPEFPPLEDLSGHVSRAQVADVISKGRGRMPGFPQLPAEQRDALIEFLTAGTKDEAAAHFAALPAAMRAEFGKLGGSRREDYLYTGYEKFRDPDGYPAAAPPWGTLNAIDLNTGAYLWKVPLGEYPVLMAKGMAVTGTENYGGPLLTSTRLLFIGATVYDRKFRAFDARTGQVLWQGSLPYAGVATPITYAVDGRQYVVIAASGARDPRGPQGSAYVAFALPRK